MEEKNSVSEHILKMSGYYNHFTQLGVELPVHCVIDGVLQSLPPSYKGFVMNYNMQGMKKTILELFVMLKSTMVKKTTSFKNRAKGKKRELQEEWQASCHSREETQSWTQA